MSALPQGAFAALKIRQSMSEDKKFGNDSFKAEKQTTVYPPVNNKCKFYNIHCFMSSIPVSILFRIIFQRIKPVLF